MTEKNLFISQLGATTKILNAEIKKQIIEVKAVKTGKMKNTTKVKVGYDFARDVFTIKSVNSTFYYIFVDQGTIHIKPRRITDKTLDRQTVESAFDRLYDKWMDYMVARQFEVIGL
jgi:hypothetical protein